MAGNSDLQAPHFPTSERCFAGMRLTCRKQGNFELAAWIF